MDDLPFLWRGCLGCARLAFTSSLLLSNVRPVDTMVGSDVDEPGVMRMAVSFGEVALGFGRGGLARQQDGGLVFPPATLCMLIIKKGSEKEGMCIQTSVRGQFKRVR
jgi:hypothetical protein